MKVKVLAAQPCPTLCDSTDGSPPGPSLHGILQARTLQWVAIPFSSGIFPTQGSNPGLLHCRQMLYHWAAIMNYLCAGSVTQLCLTLQFQGLQSTSLLCPWNFSDKNIGVGYHFLRQGIFSIHGHGTHVSCTGRQFLHHWTTWEAHIIDCCMHAQSLSCVQVWEPMECSPPGSSVLQNFPARILEWDAIFYSRDDGLLFSHRKEWSIGICSKWMDLEKIILNEVSQTERQMLYDTIFMWNLKCNTNESMFKIETDLQTWNTNLWLPKGKTE